MAVDSKQRQLEPEQIIKQADAFAQSKVDPELAYAVILKEINIPGTVLFVAGNTLFIVHSSKEEGVGIFRPINADTAENFAANCIEFGASAHKMGFKQLVSFPADDDTPIRIINLMKRQFPPSTIEGFDVEIKTTTNGKPFVIMKMG